MSSTTRYRVPCVTPEPVELVSVSLDDFDLDEIREYLARADEGLPDSAPRQVEFNTSLLFSSHDLNRIETLALCGQIEPARQLALGLIAEHIGRPL